MSLQDQEPLLSPIRNPKFNQKGTIVLRAVDRDPVLTVGAERTVRLALVSKATLLARVGKVRQSQNMSVAEGRPDVPSRCRDVSC